MSAFALGALAGGADLPCLLQELPQRYAAAVDAADEVEGEAVGIGIAEDVDR